MANATKIGTRKWIRFRCYNNLVSPRVAADPTSLTAIVVPPRSPAVSFTWPDDAEVVREEEGVFRLYYTTTEADRHEVRGEATGALVVAEQTSFTVVAKNTP